MADPIVLLRDTKFAMVPLSGRTADVGRALRTINGQSFPEVDKTEFIAKYWVGDAAGNPVPSAGTVEGGDATLRTDMASNAGFTLIKHKRSGTNTFARTAGQLAALGSESDFSIMHWIDPAQDEAVLDGSIAVDQAASFTNALTDIGALAGKKGLILPPGVTLRNDSGMDLHVDNLVVQAHGAKIVSALSTTDPLIQVTGEDVQILGLSTLLTAAATTAHHFRLIGARPKIHMCSMDYAVDQNTPGFYIKQADGAEVTHCRFRGANAFMGYIEGSDLLLAFNDLDAAPGGDDAFALKAINRPSENIRIIGNRIKGFATMLSIGSNVGMNLADDPTHSRYVANVIFADNVGDTCGGMLTIRPGGTAGQDYRDGVVDGLTFSNNRMRDPTGAKATHLLQITPGQRGAVRNVKGDKNAFMGRMNVASQFGLFVFRSVGDQSSLDNFDIELDCFDPFAGAAHGALITAVGTLGPDPVEGYDVGDAVPGYPMESLTSIDDSVLCSRINIRMSADGTSINGVLVLSGLDDAVSIERLNLANINATSNANAAGVRTLSRVHIVGDDIKISRASKIHAGTVNAYRCDNGTTGAIVCSHADIVHFAESVAAGTDKTKTVWAPPRNAYVAKVEVLSTAAVATSPTGNDYVVLGVYDPDNANSQVHAFSSEVQPLEADTFTKVVQGNDLSAANQGRLHFDKGERLKFEKNDVGTGNAIADALVRVHWAPY